MSYILFVTLRVKKYLISQSRKGILPDGQDDKRSWEWSVCKKDDSYYYQLLNCCYYI